MRCVTRKLLFGSDNYKVYLFSPWRKCYVVWKNIEREKKFFFLKENFKYKLRDLFGMDMVYTLPKFSTCLGWHHLERIFYSVHHAMKCNILHIKSNEVKFFNPYFTVKVNYQIALDWQIPKGERKKKSWFLIFGSCFPVENVLLLKAHENMVF